jgi:hypothetical protein
VVGFLPAQFQMRHPPRHIDQVKRSVADDSVGNVHLAAAGVASLRNLLDSLCGPNVRGGSPGREGIRPTRSPPEQRITGRRARADGKTAWVRVCLGFSFGAGPGAESLCNVTHKSGWRRACRGHAVELAMVLAPATQGARTSALAELGPLVGGYFS